MTKQHRFLVAESASPEDRDARRNSVGRSSGETYAETLRSLVPQAHVDRMQPAEEDSPKQDPERLRRYDAVFLCGSPLHLYEDSPAVRRQVEFMRAVFASGTPAFGSCAGLQVATVAAGGSVRPNVRGREAGFSRRITLTVEGAGHPLLAGRPPAFDAPSIHSDEVERLPEGAILLATNAVTRVQAAEIRYGEGVFWGVQYHPELSLLEVAQALRQQANSLVKDGLAHERSGIDAQADLIAALDGQPDRRDLAWRLGIDRQVTDPTLRQAELRNFLRYLLDPTRMAGG